MGQMFVQRICRINSFVMTRRIIIVGLCVLFVVSCGNSSRLPATSSTASTTASTTAPAVLTLPVVNDDASGDASATTTPDAELDTTPSPTTEADTVSSIPPDSTLPSPPTTIEPAVPGVVITSWTIVDGDTINTDGQSIRILGYDTPERGECGYDEAGEFLADLLATGTVSLVADSGDDTDRYGRLLRHVLVDGKPVGLSMIEAGKANARYDALDGYPRHRYQDRYRDADSANTFSCVVVSLPQTSSSAEPWNQPGPDLDCSDIGRKVRIAGIDYHRLDSDGDGWGCESYG